jgi:hypothetical protein
MKIRVFVYKTSIGYTARTEAIGERTLATDVLRAAADDESAENAARTAASLHLDAKPADVVLTGGPDEFIAWRVESASRRLGVRLVIGVALVGVVVLCAVLL